MKCPKCQVSLAKTEFEKGECELCGWERSRDQRLAARKSASPKVAKISTIPADREVDEFARFGKELIHFFIEIWDQGDNASPNPVIMKNRAASTHQRYASGHQIAFSWYALDNYKKDSIGFTWANRTFSHVHEIGSKGKKAVYELAVHEFAHWLQTERGQRFRGSQHNQYWANAVAEIKELCPFAEIANL